MTARKGPIHVGTAARLECERKVLAFLRQAGWVCSADVAKHLGIDVTYATKRLVNMKVRGLVVRMGVAKCHSTWAPIDDERAVAQAAQDAAKPRNRPTRKVWRDGFVQRVVDAQGRRPIRVNASLGV